MLDVRYIKNANPTWARNDLGSLEDLTMDIKSNGIMKPLLIRRDGLMVDGARRFTVATALKLSTVPIVFIDTWDDLVDNFDPTAPDTLPMCWPDLLGFWNNILKPIYNVHRYHQARVTLKHKAETGDQPPRPVYSAYIRSMASLYGTEPATIKTLRDYFVKLERTRNRFPVFYKGIMESLPLGESARDLTQSRFIKSLLERLLVNEISEEEAVIVFNMRLRQGTSKRSFFRASQVRYSANAAPVDNATVDRLMTKLEAVALTASEFQNFKMKSDEAADFSQRMTAALSQLMGLRRRMQTAVRLQEKSKEQE